MARSKKYDLLCIALKLARKHGYREVTREMIANSAGSAEGTVSFQLGTMKQMRRVIVRHAIRTNDNKIIAQAILAGDPLVKNLSDSKRRTALLAVV